MTLVGFKSMTVRVLDGQETITAERNLFVVEGKEHKGATQKVDIKGLAADVSKAYGSNLAYYVSRKGVGDVTADFEILDLPFLMREVLLGYKKAGQLSFIGADTEAPYCSVLLESEDLAGNPVYLGFFKGSFSAEEFSAETRKEKTDEPSADKLTYTALAGEKGEASGQYVAYYIGSDETELNKLKALLGMVAAG